MVKEEIQTSLCQCQGWLASPTRDEAIDALTSSLVHNQESELAIGHPGQAQAAGTVALVEKCGATQTLLSDGYLDLRAYCRFFKSGHLLLTVSVFSRRTFAHSR